MAIQFELYKTPRPKDEADKETYHARVVNFQHIDTDYLARQIQTATSLTEGDVKSVLESLSHFMGGAAPGRGKRPFGWYRLLSDKAEQSGTNHFAQTKGKPNQTQSQHQFQGGYQT